MSPDQLQLAGQAMFGTQWQSELARALGVSVRTVQRWAAGVVAVPAHLVPDLQRLLADRIQRQAAVLAQLLAAAPPG